jgi:hypothetical protein
MSLPSASADFLLLALFTLLTTSNISASPKLQNSQITTTPKPFSSLLLFTCHSLTMASDSEHLRPQVLFSQPSLQNSTELTSSSQFSSS